MAKAKEIGELMPGVDVGAALAVLYSPVYTPLLFGQPVPDEASIARIFDIACRGIFANAN